MNTTIAKLNDNEPTDDEISIMLTDEELAQFENGKLRFSYLASLKPYSKPKLKRVYVVNGYTCFNFNHVQLGKWAKCKMFNHTLRA